MKILRPDQLQFKAEIHQAWNQGAKNVLGVAVTGFGKSVNVSDLVADQYQLGSLVSVIAHRVELVSQMSMHIADCGIKHRLIAPKEIVSDVIAEHRREYNGRSFINPDANITVAGIDTLNSRETELKSWADQQDLWIIDEAHHVIGNDRVTANKWGRGVAMFPRARGLGVTATPQRADGQGLGRHSDSCFDAMVLGPDMRTLIDRGSLTDFEIVLPPSDYHLQEKDITPGGDFSPKKMAEESKRSHIIGDVVREYVKYAFGKRAICFATDVDAANKIANCFNTLGIPAAAVSAKTPSHVRAEFIRRFRAGQIWVLVNVDLFGEGFDVPACEVVIMARPTASLGLYLQMCGRALRVINGKIYGLIIDHVSNVLRHGLPDKYHYWSLDRRDKKAKKEKDPEDIELIACRECSRPYERVLPACPHCGAVLPIPAPGGRSIEAIDGDLMLLDRDKLAALRAARTLASPADVGARAAFVGGAYAGAARVTSQIAKHAAQQRMDGAIATWARIQRGLGRSDAESYRRFYVTLGVDVMTAGTLPAIDMEAIAVKVEGWLT